MPGELSEEFGEDWKRDGEAIFFERMAVKRGRLGVVFLPSDLVRVACSLPPRKIFDPESEPPGLRNCSNPCQVSLSSVVPDAIIKPDEH